MVQIALVLPLLVGAVACGGATPVKRAMGSSEAVTGALSDAVRLIRGRRLDDAERRLAESRPVAAQDEHELERLDYFIATIFAYRNDLGRALRLIRAHAAAASGRGDVESEAWMQSCASWLRWAASDLGGAIAENERIEELITDDVDRVDRRAMLLLQHWDRAFFLLEQAIALPAAAAVAAAEAQPAAEAQAQAQAQAQGARETALREARDARDAYETLAGGSDQSEELKLLSGWFDWRAGNADAAAAALRGIHPDDVRGMFIISVVLEATGEKDAAAKARSQLRESVNLIAPLLDRAATRLLPGLPRPPEPPASPNPL